MLTGLKEEIMRKLFKIVLLGVLLLGFVSGTASAYLVDTGPGLGDPWSLGGINGQCLAAEFSLDNLSTITSIEGWIICWTGGNLVAAIYSDGGDVPGTKIFSTSFSITKDTPPTWHWHGAIGLDWTLKPGTYWVVFEIPQGSAVVATMPGSSSQPLGNEAYKLPGNPWIPFNTLDIGVRIDGSPVTVKPPSIAHVLLLLLE